MDDEAYTPPPWPVRLFDASVYWVYHGGWKIIGALIVGVASGASAVWLSGPRSYEDCVFRYVTNATTGRGASAAQYACDKMKERGAFTSETSSTRRWWEGAPLARPAKQPSGGNVFDQFDPPWWERDPVVTPRR